MAQSIRKFLASHPVACGLAVGASVAALLQAASPAPAGPLAEVDPAAQRLVADNATDGKVRAEYRVTNRGGGDLVLGEATTSCGCSVASIAPRVVGPGRTALIRVEGSPPGAGEKDVFIRVACNAGPQRELTLKLTMVGVSRPPYVASNSTAAGFGEVRPLDAGSKQPVFVETREVKGREPWLHAVESTLGGLSVRGGKVRELDFGGDVVYRRYEYSAELAQVPGPGRFAGELLFKAREPGAAPILRIPVHGLVRPPVYAAPSGLFASFDPGATPPRLKVRLAANEPGFNLSAEPTPESSAFLDVRKAADPGETGLVFDVGLRDRAGGTVATTLVFRTNHSGSPEVRVPIMFRRSSGG